MILVTGKTGVGKTTILKGTNLKNIIYLDEVVKNILYKRKSKLYWDIKNTFGKQVVNFFKVNTKKLGKLVFSDSNKLEKLDELVYPHVKEYLKKADSNSIVEMAVYLKKEKIYKDLFDKVILIDREQHLENKFKYLDKKVNPIKEAKIKYDLLIDDKDINEAINKIIDYVK